MSNISSTVYFHLRKYRGAFPGREGCSLPNCGPACPWPSWSCQCADPGTGDPSDGQAKRKWSHITVHTVDYIKLMNITTMKGASEWEKNCETARQSACVGSLLRTECVRCPWHLFDHTESLQPLTAELWFTRVAPMAWLAASPRRLSPPRLRDGGLFMSRARFRFPWDNTE